MAKKKICLALQGSVCEIARASERHEDGQDYQRRTEPVGSKPAASGAQPRQSTVPVTTSI